ncbi:hypothetical protein EIP86_001094 [Pleurotus ostreatoroseus]|nr:hypothetical protein EIP86_001094 [Pleurotus ostreatoroseus]
MKRLGTRVNLIPVIAKADTLTQNDLAKFKQRHFTVRDSIAALSVSLPSGGLFTAFQWNPSYLPRTYLPHHISFCRLCGLCDVCPLSTLAVAMSQRPGTWQSQLCVIPCFE